LRSFPATQLPEEVQNLWSAVVSSDSDIVTSLALIFARAGAETGKVKRVMDEDEISWGYFTDHNPFEPHCNAHANNFLVIDPSSNSH